jgi:hypothetical protein
VDSQAILDEIVVKNSDDIVLIKKVKRENDDLIKNLEARIDLLDKETQKSYDMIEKFTNIIEKQNDKKQTRCRYHNRGYCRNQTWCLFSHTEEICKSFLEEGKCLSSDCLSRHPKTCSYWKKGYCFRGEQCAFSHRYTLSENKESKLQTCENCKEQSHQLYYCEFCESSFCNKCTIKEAHDEYYCKTTNIVDCEQIHKMKQNLYVEHLDTIANETNCPIVVDNSAVVDQCECGKPKNEENFNCIKCGKYFCTKCPTGPIESNCLLCLMSESRPISSTPIKKC